MRFSSGRIAEDLNSAIQTIEMTGIQHPITVKVDGMDIRLQDETGKEINENLKSGEKIVISKATINKLKVSGELIPDVYALEQNYPNPFNPSTTIKFSLPEATTVKLTIYNALGELVSELVNNNLEAGNHIIEFDASQFASGVYLYRINTNDFVEAKKMVLTK
jgi:hypothetical protein